MKTSSNPRLRYDGLPVRTLYSRSLQAFCCRSPVVSDRTWVRIRQPLAQAANQVTDRILISPSPLPSPRTIASGRSIRSPSRCHHRRGRRGTADDAEYDAKDGSGKRYRTEIVRASPVSGSAPRCGRPVGFRSPILRRITEEPRKRSPPQR
jgi:hypothetical protein